MPSVSSPSATCPGGARRGRAKRGEGEKLREEILVATERLILESGDEASVSIRSIAAATGITPPSIYLHFSDRNELMFAVTEREWDRLEEEMAAEVGEETDPVKRVVAKGRAYLRFGLENPEFYRILMMSRPAATPARFADDRLLETTGLDELVEEIHQAVNSGELGPSDAYETACVLWASIHGLVSLMISKPDFPWPTAERMFEQMVNTLFAGIGRGVVPFPDHRAGGSRGTGA